MAVMTHSPQGGNRIEIVLRVQYRDYGGMKLDPIVKVENQNNTTTPLSIKFIQSPSH